MNEGKSYFEVVVGDILRMAVDVAGADLSFMKNPMRIMGHISSGDFVFEISTPFTEEDFQEVIDTLKTYCITRSGEGRREWVCVECGGSYWRDVATGLFARTRDGAVSGFTCNPGRCVYTRIRTGEEEEDPG